MIQGGLILAIGLVVAGIAVGVWSSRLPNGKQKGLGNFVATSLACSAFCVAGFCNLVGIYISGHSSARGLVSSLTQSHGKNTSSRFYVIGPDGRWLDVNCDYAGDHLFDGEFVSVEILDFHSTLLQLSVEKGPYAGWRLSEGNGRAGSLLAISLGLFLIYAAHAKWKRDPEAQENGRHSRTPQNGVDDKSLLNLSGRDEGQ